MKKEDVKGKNTIGLWMLINGVWTIGILFGATIGFLSPTGFLVTEYHTIPYPLLVPLMLSEGLLALLIVIGIRKRHKIAFQATLLSAAIFPPMILWNYVIGSPSLNSTVYFLVLILIYGLSILAMYQNREAFGWQNIDDLKRIKE